MSKDALFQLIGQNKLQEAIAELSRWIQDKQRKDLEGALQLIKAQYEQYETDRAGNLDLPQHLSVRASQIRAAIIELVEKVDGAAPLKARMTSKKWFWPLLVAGLALIGFFIGLQKKQDITFKLEAQTNYVAFRFEKAWDLDFDFYFDQMEAYPLQSLTFNQETIQADDLEGEPLELYLEGPRMKLEKLPVPPGAAVSFALDKTEILFSIFDASLSGLLTIQEAEIEHPLSGEWLIVGDSSPSSEILFQTRESAEFSWFPCADCPFEINRPIAITGIDLTRKSRATDAGDLTSAIESGTVTISNIDNPIPKGQFVDIIEPKNTYLTLKKMGNSLTIMVEGKADDVRIGYDLSDAPSVKPTLIEYYAKNEQANLYWNALLFFITTLVAIWNFLKK